MDILRDLVEGYLESTDFTLRHRQESFIVAARQAHIGQTIETILIWVPSKWPQEPGNARDQFEEKLRWDFEDQRKAYPDAVAFLLVPNLGGISRRFRSTAVLHRVKIMVPTHFFDVTFRNEKQVMSEVEDSYTDQEEKKAYRNLVKAFREIKILGRRDRAPQPYSVLVDGQPQDGGDDLLTHFLEQVGYAEDSGLRIVVGPAGIGKSVLFESLFFQLWQTFQEKKRQHRALTRGGKLRFFPKPIPLTPVYQGRRAALSAEVVVGNFIHEDIAGLIPRKTLEWMLMQGALIWLWDGLDELYTRDDGYFDYILDLLTRGGSCGNMIVFARESLLTSSDSFAETLTEYSSLAPLIRLYRLEQWDHSAKRHYAWLNFEGRAPKGPSEENPPEVADFLGTLSKSDSLRALSGLPYYCSLLIREFDASALTGFSSEFELVAHSLEKIINREVEKGLLLLGHFSPRGFNDWLDEVAWEFYDSGFSGVSTETVELYADAALREDLSQEKRDSTITTLLQFPIFSAGSQHGEVSFQHELIAEYLTARYMAPKIARDPFFVATSLKDRINFSDTLLARQLASEIPRHISDLSTLIDVLKKVALPDRAFANFLQLILLIDPARDIIRKQNIRLQGQKLNRLQFVGRDLAEVSFCNCDLSDTVFKNCDLTKARFEGAFLSGTRFEKVSSAGLRQANFANLERFRSIYVDGRRIDDLREAAKWTRKVTGRVEEIKRPCSATLQIMTFLHKFIRQDGTTKRNAHNENVFLTGKRHKAGPSPRACLEALLRFGFITRGVRHDHIRRAMGDRHAEIVQFITDWKVSPQIRQMLSSICKKAGCQHVPSVGAGGLFLRDR